MLLRTFVTILTRMSGHTTLKRNCASQTCKIGLVIQGRCEKCIEIQCTDNNLSIAKSQGGELSSRHCYSAGSGVSDKAPRYGLPWALLQLGGSSFVVAVYVYFSVCIFYQWYIVAFIFLKFFKRTY